MSGVLESLGKSTSGVLSSLGDLLDDAGVVAGKYATLQQSLDSTSEELATGTTYTSTDAKESLGYFGTVAGVTTASIAVVVLLGLVIWKALK
ncbi:MAG: hypothetical protein CML13_16010 [Puniceicoccaceae bacterium]|nr:hypothetical protein [Puniceicoccaceae bacterium]|tara:strand:+ start:9903 stop:10178 length:276 start_codon:yes stop_codon:yes gene_type:complete